MNVSASRSRSPPPRALPLRRAPAAAGAAPSETFPGAPVILISVDTLRSDHLPFYGYTGVETPALTALRKDSILFESAWSHVPLTLPSHASILTGREPAGARHPRQPRLPPAEATSRRSPSS